MSCVTSLDDLGDADVEAVLGRAGALADDDVRPSASSMTVGGVIQFWGL